MRAIISARTAKAFITDGDQWWYVTYGDVSSPINSTQLDADLELRNTSDAFRFSATTLQEIRDKLEDAVDYTEATDCMLYLLDSLVSSETKDLIATELEELLSFPDVSNHIELVFLSRPLPDSATVVEAIEACARSSANLASSFFNMLNKHQVSVRAVWIAWQTTTHNLKTEVGNDFFADFISVGFFRDLAKAGSDDGVRRKALELLNLTYYKTEAADLATQLVDAIRSVSTLSSSVARTSAKLSDAKEQSEESEIETRQSTSKYLQSNVRYILNRVIGALLLLQLWPVILVLWLAVKVTSKGAGFYTQRRVGFGGREFDLIKLRTMLPNAEQHGIAWATHKDPRISPLGKILRELHLDELPQLWNVARGDMCLVGPRPERPEIVDSLRVLIPNYDLRHSVMPGITGLAQVNLEPDFNINQTRKKQILDLRYMENATLLLELRLLFATFLRVVGVNGHAAIALCGLRATISKEELRATGYQFDAHESELWNPLKGQVSGGAGSHDQDAAKFKFDSRWSTKSESLGFLRVCAVMIFLTVFMQRLVIPAVASFFIRFLFASE